MDVGTEPSDSNDFTSTPSGAFTGRSGGEHRTLAHLTDEANAAVESADYLLDKRQTYARTDVLLIALGLIERLEDALLVVLRNAATEVGNTHLQHIVLHIERHEHLAALLRELYGVGDKIAHHLLCIVGHEVAHGLLLLRGIQETDAVGVCHVEMALNDVGEEENHVATMPVALAHSRLHLLYVEELID